VTGPASGGLERGTGAPARSTGTQGAVGAILIVLALGLTLRVIIAYLLPGSGFEVDLGAFRFWASDLATNGPMGFYDREFFHDYTPGYLYVLWLVGVVGNAVGGIGDLIKVPPILADLVIGWLVWSMIRELGGRDRLALAGAVVAIVNPISWFDSVVWGQVDAFGVVFLLLALRSLWRDQPERAAIFTVIAAIIKPQLGILVPLVAVVTIRRALWPIRPAAADVAPDGRADSATVDGDIDRSAASVRDRIRAWEARTGTPWRILTTGLAGYLTAVVLCLPFGLSVIEVSGQAPFISSGLIDQIVIAGGGYPYLTVNAYNAWALVPGDTGHSLANAGLWVCDAVQIPADRCGAGIASFGPVPAVAVGALLLVAAIVGALWVAARRPDRLTLLVVLAVLALAFFAVPTRVHERYGFPFFALGAILFAISVRWRIAYVVLSIATFANMYVVLTTLYPDNPSISDWLGIGELIRSQAGVATVAVAHTLAFAWAFWQLRSHAAARLAVELEDAGDDARAASPQPQPSDGTAGADLAVDLAPEGPRPVPAMAVPVDGAATVGPAPADLPMTPGVWVAPVTWSARRTFSEAGISGWFRDRIVERPFRLDRSAGLRGERGGRLDRLDAWILVVLVLATLGMRTFRLGEPYQMHFDEVYHARTATEFLQGWRYGLDHDIYEWTHPHLAKYVMAGGIALWGQDAVRATSDLDVPVTAAAIEHRRADLLGTGSEGERVHVATGSEIRSYDLHDRRLVGVVSAPGSTALAIDPAATQLVVGFDDGRIATVDLTAVGLGGVDVGLQPIELARVDHPVTHLLVTDDGATIIAASDTRLTAVTTADGTVAGTLDLPGIADLSPAGTGEALVAVPAAIDDPAALASDLADVLGGDAADYQATLDGAADPDAQVVLGDPGSGDDRTALEEAINRGTLAGVEITDLARVAVATADGVTFIDPTTAGVSSSIAIDGGGHGLAMVVGVDDPRLYVTSGPADDPMYDVIAVGGDSAKDGPVSQGRHPLPGAGTAVAYDDASQQVHILGRAPVVDGATNAAGGADPDAAGWTVYVVEPHGNAVYADAALPEGMVPSAWAMDIEPEYVSADRQELLVFGADGTTASIGIGSHAFAWRLPGVIAGALMAAFLYLLTRILFKRRIVAVLVGAFALLDGMLFVQSRIGMNDVYVGLFIIAAYTVFAAVWTGWWRGRSAFWIAMPIVGLLLGLALASKWVAAYAIGALVLLLLIRSALGRVLAILGMIGITSVLGYLALVVPEGQGIGNVTFLVIMIALTLIGVVAAVMHPVAWTDEEQWIALLAPAAAGAFVFFSALALGALDATVTIGSLELTPLYLAFALALGSLLVAGTFWLGGRAGYGPLAAPPGPDDPGAVLDPPAPPAEGWLRPGWLAGLPLVWAAISLLAIPLVVYVALYIPWALIDNHQLWAGVPVGHTGQTLVELTGQMYGYHNGLTSAHPASSPWWAWPFDLKPVWFYQDSFAGGTTAAIYDSGNLVIWWLGAAAMLFVAIQAFRRRSLALTLIAVGFAAQWVPWARIDRAAFQYHYYTALPFVVMALAYFVAELWHGASRRTWLAARIVAGLAIIGPAAMWILSRPLCAFVGVESVNPGSAACPAVIPDFVLTVRTAGLLAVVVIGAIVLGRGILALQRDAEAGSEATPTSFRGLIVAAIGVAIGFAAVAVLPDTPIITLTSVPVEPIALIIGLPLAYFAAQVVVARDARRYIAGLIVAVGAWFVVLYPNLSALPLPSTVANAYQGLLPTYLYAFQFPVSTAERNLSTPLLSPTLAILTTAIGVTCLVVAYSASVWRLAIAESNAAAAGIPTDDPSDGLARSGGGA
jgi:C-terminal four TMM region of protein-O-mannosyltransferase/Dolichyl-phosphate-mannose-protein mannosyltransferase